MKQAPEDEKLFPAVHEAGTSIWEKRGVSRRDFMKFCTAMTAALSLPATMIPQVAAALESDTRPSVLWLEFQSCTGDTEALLRAAEPTVADIILNVVSLDYSETVMAAAGNQAEEQLHDIVKKMGGKYIAVVEGSIPTGANGAYCCIGGRSALQIAREVCNNALATIAVGTCASYGGIPAAAPNPTGAVGIGEAVPGLTLVNLPGCPVNTDNLTATIVYFLTFGRLPAVDGKGRPLFAYGKKVHDNCERRAHFDAGQYVEVWGDQAHRLGHCLYKMGCKGPATFHNCPIQKYNEKTSWPVGAGHGCAGCSEPAFWDSMTPFYRRLPNVPGFGIEATADKIGIGLVAAAAAGFGIHGALNALRKDKEPDASTEEE